MAKRKTQYQLMADQIREQNPNRIFLWYQNRLFRKKLTQWIEFAYVSSGSWYRVTEEMNLTLNKELINQ